MTLASQAGKVDASNSAQSPAYPPRPPFFACNFARMLADNDVATELGPQAAWLLTVVAMKEDQFRYARPVCFYNEQLVRMLGVGSMSSLDRVRTRCVEMGWLHYVPGGRRMGPGTYWVTVPEHYAGAVQPRPTEKILLVTGDEQTGSKLGATEVCSAPVTSKPGAKREQNDEQSGSKPGPFLPIPNPDPLPVPENKNTALPSAKPEGDACTAPQEKSSRKARTKPGEDDEGFKAFYAAYPLHVSRAKALAAWKKLNPAPELVALILAGVERYRTTKPDWQSFAHPASWLNARRWEDEATTRPPKESAIEKVIREAREQRDAAAKVAALRAAPATAPAGTVVSPPPIPLPSPPVAHPSDQPIRQSHPLEGADASEKLKVKQMLALRRGGVPSWQIQEAIGHLGSAEPDAKQTTDESVAA